MFAIKRQWWFIQRATFNSAEKSASFPALPLSNRCLNTSEYIWILFHRFSFPSSLFFDLVWKLDMGQGGVTGRMGRYLGTCFGQMTMNCGPQSMIPFFQSWPCVSSLKGSNEGANRFLSCVKNRQFRCSLSWLLAVILLCHIYVLKEGFLLFREFGWTHFLSWSLRDDAPLSTSQNKRGKKNACYLKSWLHVPPISSAFAYRLLWVDVLVYRVNFHPPPPGPAVHWWSHSYKTNSGLLWDRSLFIPLSKMYSFCSCSLRQCS